MVVVGVDGVLIMLLEQPEFPRTSRVSPFSCDVVSITERIFGFVEIAVGLSAHSQGTKSKDPRPTKDLFGDVI